MERAIVIRYLVLNLNNTIIKTSKYNSNFKSRIDKR